MSGKRKNKKCVKIYYLIFNLMKQIQVIVSLQFVQNTVIITADKVIDYISNYIKDIDINIYINLCIVLYC